MAGDRVVYEAHGASPSWQVIVAPALIAVVEPTADAATARSLWQLASRRSVSIEDAVGVLPLTPGAASFAVVRFADGGRDGQGSTVTVVARGDAAVDIYSADGMRRFTAAGIEPWLLADFRGTRAIAIQSAGLPSAASPQAGQDALPLAAGIVAADRVLWAHFGAEIARGRGPRTRAVESVPMHPAGTRGSHVARPHDPAAFAYRLPGHDAVRIETPTVFGRRPSHSHGSVPRAAALVTLPSPTGSVSGSHVLVAQDGHALVITDLDSTNGTKVIPEGSRRVRLRPGQSVVVPAAAHVDVGDGNIIEVMPARSNDADGPSAAPNARGPM